MNFTGERFIPSPELIHDDIAFEHYHRYYTIASALKDKKVLDVACGVGYGTSILSNYSNSIDGLDIDQESINFAKKKYSNEKTRFFCGSCTDMPFQNGTFDVVVSFETIEHLIKDARDGFMKEIQRVLKPNGVLIISTPNKINYSERYQYRNEFHFDEFNKLEFIEFIERFFKFKNLYNQGFEIVSIIDNESIFNEPKINVVNPHIEKNIIEQERKYFLVVASNHIISSEFTSLSSVIPKIHLNFLDVFDKLIGKNKEIEKLGAWGKNLDLQVESLQNQLVEKINENQELENSRKALDLQVESLQYQLVEKINENQELENSRKALDLQVESLQYQLVEKINEIEIEKNKSTLVLLKQKATLIKLDVINHFFSLKKRYFSHSSRNSIVINSFLKKIKVYFKIPKDNSSIANHNISNLTSTYLPIPYFQSPIVSIIIPVYNNWDYTLQCINSIIEYTHEIPYEIIIADDCSTDLTKNCCDFFENIVHIKTDGNVGFVGNCNNAAKYAKGHFIYFLNNDTRVTLNWLSSCLSLINNDNSIGMVGSKLIYPNGDLQEAGGIIWKDASGWNYGRNQNPNEPQFNYVKEVDYISGAAILIRKDLWNQIEGFDERYSPAYFEDTDLAFTLRKIGYKVIYQPLSVIIHFEGISHGNDEIAQEDPTSIKNNQELNKIKFHKKWSGILDADHYNNAQNVFLARDRSSKKKTILIIDHYVPMYDKDAGSRTTFLYLKLFVSLGLNVKFIGDNFAKFEPYTTELQQLGIEVLYGDWHATNWKNWIIDNAQYLEYILISRPHISIKYIDFLRENTKSKIIYLGHDLHFLREKRKYELDSLSETLESVKNWEEIENYLFHQSDTILTFSELEKEIISSINKKYVVKTIPLFFYNKAAANIIDFTKRSSIMFVGGFGHTPNIDAMMWFCNEVWPLVLSKTNQIQLIIAGSNPTDEILSFDSDSIKVLGYQTEKELEALYGRIKIAIIPLRFGAGVKGKTIEAMYQGIPIVSTSIGLEGIPTFDETILKKCDDANSFAEEIISLYFNNQKLEELSKYETTYINNYFTTNMAKHTMSNILEL